MFILEIAKNVVLIMMVLTSPGVGTIFVHDKTKIGRTLRLTTLDNVVEQGAFLQDDIQRNSSTVVGHTS